MFFSHDQAELYFMILPMIAIVIELSLPSVMKEILNIIKYHQLPPTQSRRYAFRADFAF